MTQKPPVTIPIAFVHGMLSGVVARGVSTDSFVADAGIAPELLAMPGARVGAAQYVALFQLLTNRLDDEMLGFLSRPLRRGSFALIAHSALGAPTLEAAMRRIARTLLLLQDDLVLDAVCEGPLAGWGLRFASPSTARPTFLHELLMRALWRLLAWLAGGQLPAARFDFAFASPPYNGGYAAIFTAPLQFEQPLSALWFEAERLRRPVRRDEAALRTFLADAQAQIIVPRRGDDAVGERVRRHLLETQPQWPDLATTASAMNMSTTTLKRRLAVEGTAFQALKDELRRDVAIQRLNTSTVPMAAIAHELGFADTAAFQRAFKCWTGSAPGVYRRGGA
ncbi:AraC family transcriptional regulator [Variovorax sp. GT1P44]|uniref:AraC family transcriptional regulator n=1 Tax=Variovorax sp. GT1P44 TaxID=3443742 RepID=UPI003F45561E